MPRLTPTDVRDATRTALGKTQQILYDKHGSGKGEGVAGFGVRLYPSGAKSYVLRYRPQGSRTLRTLPLGTARELSLEQARKLALAKLAEVRLGGDPAQQRKQAREATTVAELADEYLARHAVKLRSAGATARRMKRHVLPRLGTKKLAEVTQQDVRRLHTALTTTNGAVEANRVLALVRGMWNRAAEWGLVPEGAPNPATHVKPNRERSRERWVQTDELPHLLAAIDACANPHIRAALHLYLLTGCRRSELLRLRWRDVDLRRRAIYLRETKNAEPRTVHLNDEAAAVLGELGPGIGAAPVFPGDVPGKPLVNINRAWHAVRTRCWLAMRPREAERLRARAEALVERAKKHARKGPEAVEAQLVKLANAAMKKDGDVLRLHDLRRTVGATMATSGVSLLVVGKVLGHKSTQATAVYARIADDAARRALEQHGEHMSTVRPASSAARR